MNISARGKAHVTHTPGTAFGRSASTFAGADITILVRLENVTYPRFCKLVLVRNGDIGKAGASQSKYGSPHMLRGLSPWHGTRANKTLHKEENAGTAFGVAQHSTGTARLHLQAPAEKNLGGVEVTYGAVPRSYLWRTL